MAARRPRAAPAADPEFDRRMMAAALRLGRRNLGRTGSNPAVGCIIVRTDGDAPVVVGRGWTAEGGRPHAEKEALKEAGAAAAGATVYVTLEPCAHKGRTKPCSEALIDAKVARVVTAMVDPDPRTQGKGIAALEAAGIARHQRRARRRGGARPFRPYPAADERPAACDAEACGFRRRHDRHARRRAHDHHQQGGVRRRAGDAHQLRRGDGRHRHRAGRQSPPDGAVARPDRPHADACHPRRHRAAVAGIESGADRPRSAAHR